MVAILGLRVTEGNAIPIGAETTPDPGAFVVDMKCSRADA